MPRVMPRVPIRSLERCMRLRIRRWLRVHRVRVQSTAKWTRTSSASRVSTVLGRGEKRPPRPRSLANNVEAVVCLGDYIGIAVDLVEDLIKDPNEHIHCALIAPHRITMVVVPIENREADPDQRRSGIAIKIFAVCVADQKVDWLREQQRAHVPQILAGIGMAALAER